MSRRLDMVVQKHPAHEEGIRLLASRDPSGNLKYLDWSVRVLTSGQALAPEIADVIELFHRFQGRQYGRHHKVVRSDLYTYKPEDLADLRTGLRQIQRASDKKRRERERLYRIEGSVETETVYDSPDLIVRHIKNKQASVHYGLGTKWCISMLREGYFEDYETHNATFFFFERKAPLRDEFDKIALVVPRADRSEEGASAFTATDRRVDMLSLARVHGARVFDIFRAVYECSQRFPDSPMFQVYSGAATAEQLAATFANVKSLRPHEVSSALQAICCNDAAPESLLEQVLKQGPAFWRVAYKRQERVHERTRLRRRRYRRHRRTRTGTSRYATEEAKRLKQSVMAAMAIHPNVSDGLRARLIKQLKRARVGIDTIQRTTDYGRVGVAYETTTGKEFIFGRRRHRRGFRRRRRRVSTVKMLLSLAAMYVRRAARMRKRAAAKERKQKAAAKKKSKRRRLSS